MNTFNFGVEKQTNFVTYKFRALWVICHNLHKLLVIPQTDVNDQRDADCSTEQDSSSH